MHVQEYKLQLVELESLTAEENLVRMLRSYSHSSAGKLPSDGTIRLPT